MFRMSRFQYGVFSIGLNLLYLLLYLIVQSFFTLEVYHGSPSGMLSQGFIVETILLF